MNKITINEHVFTFSDQEIKVNLLTLLRSVGIKITGFCYHYLLPIAGNCRVCLVQITTIGKPIASCAYPTLKDIKILTDSPMVLSARESAINLLLLNHPLDCPTCDQAGSCDLQEITYAYGKDRGTFSYIKRSVDNFYSNKYIKPFMNRCIHCTRCIRFSQLVNGLPYYGITGRGMYSNVGTYVTSLFNSNYASSVIDLCPVGALTDASKSYSYRLWELQSKFFPDFTNFESCLLNYSFLGSKLVSITPVDNSILLSNSSRYFPIVFFNHTRLQFPLFNLKTINSPTAFEIILSFFNTYNHINIITDNIHIHLLNQYFPIVSDKNFTTTSYLPNVIYKSTINIDWSTIKKIYISNSLDLYTVVPNLALQLQSFSIDSKISIYYINPNKKIKLIPGSKIIKEIPKQIEKDSINLTNTTSLLSSQFSTLPTYIIPQSSSHLFAKTNNSSLETSLTLNINFHYYNQLNSLHNSHNHSNDNYDIFFSSILNTQINHSKLVLPSSNIFENSLGEFPAIANSTTDSSSSYLTFLFYCIKKFNKTYSITIKDSIFHTYNF